MLLRWLIAKIGSYFEKPKFSTVDEFVRRLQEGNGYTFEGFMSFEEEVEIAEEALAKGLVYVKYVDERYGRCFCRLSPPPYFPP